jgi:hypothetical protein
MYCSIVRLPLSVLDLGIVKSPLVACLVGYAWVSELCAGSLNRQLGSFNMSLLTKTSSDEVNLSSTLSHERLRCILLMLTLCAHLRASRGTRLVDIVVKKAEQHFILDVLWTDLSQSSLQLHHYVLTITVHNPGLLQAV